MKIILTIYHASFYPPLESLLALLAICTLAPSVALHAETTGKTPNVIVILVDDMGYGDIAAHGNPVIRTPQLDRLTPTRPMRWAVSHPGRDFHHRDRYVRSA